MIMCLLKEEAPWKEGDTLSVKGKGAMNEDRCSIDHREARCPDSIPKIQNYRRNRKVSVELKIVKKK